MSAWLIPLLAALVGSGVTLVLGLLAWPKLMAEKRRTDAETDKITAEADLIDYNRISRELGRLERIIKAQGARIYGLETQVGELREREDQYIREIRAKDARIAELEAMRMPVELERRHPSVTGVAVALRNAHHPPQDDAGQEMRETLERVETSEERKRKGRGDVAD